MAMLRIHGILTWIAYLLGAVTSGYVAIAGIDQVFAVAVGAIYALHGSWMLHAVALVAKGRTSSLLASKAGVALTATVLLSVSFISLCMLGLLVDVTANGQEGLDVEAYLIGLMPGLGLFHVASYLFADRLVVVGPVKDGRGIHPIWALWLSNVVFLIGFPALWRRIRSVPEGSAPAT